MDSHAPPAEELPEPIDADSPSHKRRWYVGTLSYTRAKLAALFFWLLWGDFAWSMKERAVGPVATIIIKKFHATDLLMALLLTAIPAAIGIALGPTISFRSDRFRSRWGRRIPFLALTTPFAAAAMIGLGFSAFFGRCLHALPSFRAASLDHVVLMSFGACWIVFEVATVAANAVFGALVNDVVPRELLGRFYGLFRAFSLIAGIVFNQYLIAPAEKHYASMFLAVGLFYSLGFLLMCLIVKEGRYPPPDDEPSGRHVGSLAAARLYMRECFTNPYYLWVIGSFVLAGLVFMPVNLFSLPFAHSLHISIKSYGHDIALTYLVSLYLAYPLGSLADRFHPLRTSIVAMILYALVALWGSFYAGTAAYFGIALIAHGVISGCYFTCSASLGQRLFPKMRFAQFASAAGMIGAIASMIAAPALGKYLDFTGHMYRNTYDIACALAVVSVLFLLVTHSRFVALGGPDAYVAPE